MDEDPTHEATEAEPAHPGPLVGALGHAVEDLAEQLHLKPKLRGWLHFGAGPLAFVMGLGLLVWTPEQSLRLAVAAYVLTTVMLFSVSASFHLGAGGPRTQAFLNRLDHANIYLFIAGSYTPFAAALPDPAAGARMFMVVWSMATLGLVVRVFWRSAPRWLSVASYIGLGWVSVFFLPRLWNAFGWEVVALMGVGGVLYTVGGVVYARKRPDPAPDWFGFHEVFHALTITAYVVQFAAVARVVLP